MGVLDSFRLDDKVVVVTGASSGLGVAFAEAFAEAGSDVVLGARRVDRLAETAALVEAAGRKPLAVATDVSVPEQCQALIDSAMQAFGRVDILINNAGVGSAHPATRETPEQFRSVIDVNLNGAYWMAQASGRVMQPGSSIINIASVLGITTANLPQAAYSASKAAIIGLTRDLAQQWGSRKGIRVNALAPGFFRTEMTDEYKPGYL
jgi:NAD(P)-dependent dehydrogenase (short-subunit alcohol dehydrogenase family)